MENSENNVSGGNNMKKIISIVVVILVLVAVGYFIFNKKSASKEPVVEAIATVNGVVIPKATYETQLTSAIESYKSQGVDVANAEKLAQIQAQVLDNLIGNELLAQGVKTSGITASSEEVEKQFQAILVQSGGAEKFQAELTKNNMTEVMLRENISKQLTTQAYLLKNIDVSKLVATDEEVSQFYTEYSKAQKEAGQTVPALKEISDQIKQQIVYNKQQTLISNFVASLREKAVIEKKI